MLKHIELPEENTIHYKNEGSNEHIKNKKQQNSLPKNLDFRYKRLIFWIPIITTLIIVFFGIIKTTITNDQKYYCFKSAFTATGFSPDATQNQMRQMLVNTRYSFSIYVNPFDNLISKKIAEQGTFEPQKINVIGHIVQSGHNVLIVGDQVGLNSVIIAKIIGKKGLLYVLTPRQISYNLTNKNLQLNQVKKYSKVYKFGASDHKYFKTIQILNEQENVMKQQIQYQVIDELLPSNIKLDFVYINSDKVQIAALLGMKQMIKRSPQLVIMLKWQYTSQTILNKSQLQNLIQFLSERNYKAYTYKGGYHGSNCKLGSFIWKGQLKNIQTINAPILLFFPSDYTLPM